MNDFEELDESRKLDVLNAKQNILNKSIDEAIHALSQLETRKEQLEQNFEDLCAETDELEQLNTELSSENIDIPRYTEKTKQLEFFDQLKIIEAEAEHYKAQISVYKQNIAENNAKISTSAREKSRVTKKVESLNTALSTASDRLVERRALKKQLEEQIFKEAQEIESIKNLCVSIKEDIQKQAESMQDITPEALDELVLQKNALVSEVRKAEEEKNVLETKLKQNESNYTAHENLASNSLKKEASPLVWMSERNTLMSKIRKAREELQQLSIRSKSADKVKQKTETKKEELNVSEDDVKRAIFLEMQEIESADTSFIDDAIEVEKNYQQELSHKMEEIDKTRLQIDDFREKMMNLMQQQNEAAASADRIALLKQELKELRSNL